MGFRAANAIALVVVATAVMSPWVARNYRVFGKPMASTTHGGYTFWLGNNQSFYDWLRNDRSGLPWDVKSLPPVGSYGDKLWNWHLDGSLVIPQPFELAEDRFYYRLAKLDVRRSPYGFARACFYRIGQLWSPLPHKLTADETNGRRMLRYATCAWYCGLYALAAVGVWRLRSQLVRTPWVFGLLLCLAFTAVHTFYWTNLRMRAPLMPFVALVAAAAIRIPSFNPKPEAPAPPASG